MRTLIKDFELELTVDDNWNLIHEVILDLSVLKDGTPSSVKTKQMRKSLVNTTRQIGKDTFVYTDHIGLQLINKDYLP